MAEGKSDKHSKSKYRKKLKRTFNTVISKPRILKRRPEKQDVSNDSPNDTASDIKQPDWKFSNLPVARKYRPPDDTASSDSEEDIRVGKH